MTSFARPSNFSPRTGLISHCRLFASATNSGSLSILIYPSRRILTRSGGIPGVAMIGRPNAPEPRSTAELSSTRFAKIQQHLVRLIRSYEEHLVVLLRRPDPGEFRPVKLDFFPPEKLCEIDRRGDRSKGESVRLGHTVDIVSRGYGSTTRHVLYDYVRLA